MRKTKRHAIQSSMPHEADLNDRCRHFADGPRLCENALFAVIRAIRFALRFVGHLMRRFVEGLDRGQSTLFPASLDDSVTEDHPVHAVDVFVDGLDLDKLGFIGVQPLDTGRPSYHTAVMLKSYIYGDLNRAPVSTRLGR